MDTTKIAQIGGYDVEFFVPPIWAWGGSESFHGDSELITYFHAVRRGSRLFGFVYLYTPEIGDPEWKILLYEMGGSSKYGFSASIIEVENPEFCMSLREYLDT